jgi:hypothetical protein
MDCGRDVRRPHGFGRDLPTNEAVEKIEIRLLKSHTASMKVDKAASKRSQVIKRLHSSSSG